ncbi:MAG: APC family permease [Xanthomonadales bacterium]|nr:APC family permease [Xanthomonadales bacterium]
MAHLERRLGLLGLTATGICAMLGASINVVPFMVHRSVPGIGEYVMPAFIFAALPALMAAFAYGALASTMPRAGGSYLYASRGLSPYLGFIASFSQWFGLSIVIGVIAYVIVPFLRDIAAALGWEGLAVALETGWIRVSVALAMIWLFVGINIRGLKLYARTLVPMMFLMFALGAIVIVAGFLFDHADFAAGLLDQDDRAVGPEPAAPFQWMTFLSAAALMFSSFIGFDAIAQAGGEARNPSRALPVAILLAIGTVGAFYFLFATAVYSAVPWWFVAEEALARDISAPGLLAYLLPAGLGAAILAGAAIALINDLPAMLLAVSRLMFAWAEDGIFPGGVARVHGRFHTPYVALTLSGVISSIGVLGSHFAGDFFLGIDIMVTAMLVNFLLMCLTLLNLPRANPELAEGMTVLRNRGPRLLIGGTGVVLLAGFLVIHVYKDLSGTVDAWYFHSTWVWLLVMGLGSVVFFLRRASLIRAGVDLRARFSQLPD